MALTDWPLRLLPLLGFDERRLERLRERFLTLMGDGGLIVTNVLRCAAPHHGWGWRMAALPIANTMIYNALGFPSVVVPVGWTGRRLPLAVQVVARPGEDEVALAAAAELERAFGGWRLAMA
jgi:fatty acid amide hydrolase 2